MRRANGDARPGTWHAVDARPVLGVPALRSTFLVDLPTSGPRKGETGHGASVVTFLTARGVRQPPFTTCFVLDDDPDADLDEDDDDFDADEEGEKRHDA